VRRARDVTLLGERDREVDDLLLGVELRLRRICPPFTVSVVAGEPAVADTGEMLASTSLLLGTAAPPSAGGICGLVLDPEDAPPSPLPGFGFAVSSSSVGRWSGSPLGLGAPHAQSRAAIAITAASSHALCVFQVLAPGPLLKEGRARCVQRTHQHIPGGIRSGLEKQFFVIRA
jgi:hypothetical protein